MMPLKMLSIACLFASASALLAQGVKTVNIKIEYPMWVTLTGTPKGGLTIKDALGALKGSAVKAGDTIALSAAGTYKWELGPGDFKLDLAMVKAKDAPNKLLVTFMTDPATKEPELGWQKYEGKTELAPRYSFLGNKNLWLKFN